MSGIFRLYDLLNGDDEQDELRPALRLSELLQPAPVDSLIDRMRELPSQSGRAPVIDPSVELPDVDLMPPRAPRALPGPVDPTPRPAPPMAGIGRLTSRLPVEERPLTRPQMTRPGHFPAQFAPAGDPLISPESAAGRGGRIAYEGIKEAAGEAARMVAQPGEEFGHRAGRLTPGGFPAVEQAGRDVAEAARAERASIEGPARQLHELFDQGATMDDVLEWVAFTTAQGLVSTVPAVVGGAVGAAVGGPAGALAGAGATGYFQNQNEVRQALIREGLSEAEADRISAGAAVPMAALDAIMPGRVGSKLVGPARQAALRSLAQRIIRTAGGVARGGLTEGVTETGQEAIGIGTTAAAVGRPVIPELVQKAPELLEAFGGGVLTGGLLEGAGEAVASRPAPPPPRDPLAEQTAFRLTDLLAGGAQDMAREPAPLPPAIGRPREPAPRAAAPPVEPARVIPTTIDDLPPREVIEQTARGPRPLTPPEGTPLPPLTDDELPDFIRPSPPTGVEQPLETIEPPIGNLPVAAKTPERLQLEKEAADNGGFWIDGYSYSGIKKITAEMSDAELQGVIETARRHSEALRPQEEAAERGQATILGPMEKWHDYSPVPVESLGRLFQHFETPDLAKSLLDILAVVALDPSLEQDQKPVIEAHLATLQGRGLDNEAILRTAVERGKQLYGDVYTKKWVSTAMAALGGTSQQVEAAPPAALPAGEAPTYRLDELLGGSRPLEDAEREVQAAQQKRRDRLARDPYPAIERDRENDPEGFDDDRRLDIEYRERIAAALDSGRVADARALYDEATKVVDGYYELPPDPKLAERITAAEAEAAQQTSLLDTPAPVPGETVGKSTYTAQSGRVYRGANHSDAVLEARDAGEPEAQGFPDASMSAERTADIESRMGFETSTGRIVDRDEAARIADAASQRPAVVEWARREGVAPPQLLSEELATQPERIAREAGERTTTPKLGIVRGDAPRLPTTPVEPPADPLRDMLEQQKAKDSPKRAEREAREREQNRPATPEESRRYREIDRRLEEITNRQNEIHDGLRREGKEHLFAVDPENRRLDEERQDLLGERDRLPIAAGRLKGVPGAAPAASSNRQANVERFIALYEPALRAAMKKHPDAYAYGPEAVPGVVARMQKAFMDGSYNHQDSPAIRAVARQLGLKPTRKALEEFFNSAPAPNTAFEAEVYHGTHATEPFASFDRKFSQSAPHLMRKPTIDHVGTWFTTDPKAAAAFGPTVVKARVSLANPLVTDKSGVEKLMRNFPDPERLRDHLRELGHDGLVIKGGLDNLPGDYVVAIEPKQVADTEWPETVGEKGVRQAEEAGQAILLARLKKMLENDQLTDRDRESIEARIAELAPKSSFGSVISLGQRGVKVPVKFSVGALSFDNVDGIGAVDDARNIDYRGFVAWMTPRQFLALNPHRDVSKKSAEFLSGAIKDGRAIGSPFLNVQWNDDTKEWQIFGHEGRTRIAAAISAGMDSPIPVMILPSDEMRARHLTDEMLRAPFVADPRVDDDGDRNRDVPVLRLLTPIGTSTAALAEPTATPQRIEGQEAPNGADREVRDDAPGQPGVEPAGRGEAVDAEPDRGEVSSGEQPGGEPAEAPEGAGARRGAGRGAGPGDSVGSGRRDAGRDAGRLQGLDYEITDADNVGAGSLARKAQNNLDAIRLLKQIEAEGRQATREEQAVLVKYVGWGGLSGVFNDAHKEYGAVGRALKDLLTDEEYEAARASTPNAHYTSPTVIRGMYDLLGHLGFLGGRVLEPSMGVGHFVGLMPRDMLRESTITGVELDSITGRIAKQLYQRTDVRVEGFEETRLPDNSIDVAIGNVPFGDYKIFDARYKNLNFHIHNFFFAKALDKVRPGGLVVFITSKSTMDAMKSGKARSYIADRADLVGAIRLPMTAFKGNANTEVTTDILVLRKRAPGQKQAGETFAEQHDLPNGISVNEYFIRHPEMMLGTMELADTRYRAGDPGLVAPKDQDLGEAIRGAVQRLEKDIYQPKEMAPTGEALRAADEGAKEGSLVYRDGAFALVEAGAEVPFKVPAGHVDRVRAMIGLRDLAREVLTTQRDDATDATIASAQKALNTAYDKFVKQYGPITRSEITKNDRVTYPNLAYFDEDVDAPLVESLELAYDAGTNKAIKAHIFSQRVIQKAGSPKNISSGSDALVASLDQKGKVDLEYMAGLYGRSVSDVVEELKGTIYEDPDSGAWLTADEYLSGNVRERLTLARKAAKKESRFKGHVDALEAVQPADLEPSQISVNMGSPWIPTEDMEAFIAHLLGARTGGYYKDVTVRHYTGEAVWTVEVGRHLRRGSRATDQWGTARMDAVSIIEKGMNGQQPKVFDKDADGKSVLNTKETTAAQDKLRQIEEELGQWLWRDAARASRLHRFYNDNYNNLRAREYDGAHLTLPGSNPNIKLRPHQKNSVWRYITSGNLGLFHVVGAGKTYTMAAIAMEVKRLGLHTKPMLQVPNHIVRQFGAAFRRLYPGARVLVADKDDMATAYDRKRFAARIANNDWDAIIIAHSMADRIGMSADFETKFLKERITEYHDMLREASKNKDDSRWVKQAEKAVARLDERLEKLAARENKDTTLDFEELGIDMVMVDEAHMYKNLETSTKIENPPVATAPSQRAFGLFLKTQYLDRLTPGRGVLLATGTPISNTLSEAHVMQRFLQYRDLVARGLLHFDAWAAAFAKQSPALEATAAGTYKVKTRFRAFNNLAELIGIFRQIADIQTGKMLKLPTPKLEGGKPTLVAVEATEWQQEYQKKLQYRAEHLPKKFRLEKGDDNMLAISNDGASNGLDPRMIDPKAPPGRKIPAVIERVFKEWQDGKEGRLTQMVFIDSRAPLKQAREEGGDVRWSPYDEIKEKLIALGVPAREIAFIHDANTQAQKEALFARMRSGDLRILMGSSEKMGAGTDVPDLMIALHHVDTPHKPAQIEQRDGRILRQGNKNEVVRIYQYTTEGTYDTVRWQQNVRKAGFIDAFMNAEVGLRSVEDIESRALTWQEIMAVTSGNPLVIERAELESSLQSMGRLRQAHADRQFRLRRELIELPQKLAADRQAVEDAKADKADVVDTKGDKFKVVIEGKEYTKRKDAGPALKAAIEKAAKAAGSEWDNVEIGRFAGLKINVLASSLVVRGGRVDLVLMGRKGYSSEIMLNASPEGLVQSLEALPAKLDRFIADREGKVNTGLSEIAEKQRVVDEPFKDEAKFTQMLKRFGEVSTALENLGKDKKEGQPESIEQLDDLDEETDDDFEGDTAGDISSPGGPRTRASQMRSAAQAIRDPESEPDVDIDDTGPMEAKEAIIPATATSPERTLRPISPVESVRVITALMGGKTDIFMKEFARARGMFYGAGGKMKIGLHPGLGRNYGQFAKTLNHEIGHAIDSLPDGTLKRGNLLGRIASLRDFLKKSIAALPSKPASALTSSDRSKLKYRAQKAVGTKPSDPDLLAEWKSLVETEYQQRLADEMARRGLIGQEHVHEELLALSEWWRPYDKDAATPTHVKYRESSKELYADALSVLLVSPGSLQERAPTFFDGFLAYLGQKPEVEEAYNAIQELIGQGDEAVYKARAAELEADYDLGEEIRRKSEKRLEKQPWWNHFNQLFGTRAAPVLAAEKKRLARKGGRAVFDEEYVIKHAYQEWLHGDNVNRLLVMDVVKDVQQPLDDLGITQNQAGMFLQMTRIAEGDRGGVAEDAKDEIRSVTGETDWPAARAAYKKLLAEAGNEDSDLNPELLEQAETGLLNPHGYTPAEAKRQLEGLKKELGAEKYERLVQVMDRFREIVGESAHEAARLGVYSQKAYRERILPNAGTYATFAVLDYFNGKVSGGIRHQIGTVKGVANPFTTMVLKAMALNRLNEMQRFKVVVLKTLTTDFTDVGPQKAIDKYHRESRAPKGRANLTYYVDGKLMYREVDEYIAKVFEHADLGFFQRTAQQLSTGTYKVFHPLYVMWSLAWQTRNLPRDFKRTYKNMAAQHSGKPTYRQALGAVTDLKKLVGAYAKTLPAAYRHGRRRPDIQIRQMLEDKALGRAFLSFDPFEGSSTVDRMAQRYGIVKPTETANIVKMTATKAMRAVEAAGVMQETWTKAAAYKMLGDAGLTGKQRAYIVRNLTGTPDSSDRGLGSDGVNAMFMYSNVIIAGWRADMSVATNPTSASGYWMRAVLIDFMPKMLMLAAALGWLGEEREEWMSHVPEYEKEKYLIVPVWPFYSPTADGGRKAIYARIPHDDTNRVMAAVMWALGKGADRPHAPSRAVSIVSGEFPGLNPGLNMLVQWSQFMSNRNPYDAFRGRDVVPRIEWEAGGWPRMREMLKYSMGEFGVASSAADWLGSLTGHGLRPGSGGEKAAGEQILTHIPALSAMVRMSDRGLNEEQAWELEWEQQNDARLRADLGAQVRRATSQRHYLNRIRGLGEDRLTDEQKVRRQQLNTWYRTRYLPLTRTAEEQREAWRDERLSPSERDRAEAGYRASIAELNGSLEGELPLDAPRRRPISSSRPGPRGPQGPQGPRRNGP